MFWEGILQLDHVRRLTRCSPIDSAIDVRSGVTTFQVVLFAENWETIRQRRVQGLWLCKKGPTECIDGVKALAKAPWPGTSERFGSHAMHAEEKDRGIFKFVSQACRQAGR